MASPLQALVVRGLPGDVMPMLGVCAQ